MVHAVCIIAMTLAVVLVVPRIFWVRIRIVTHWQILVLGRAYRICRNPPWVGLYELWVFAIWRHGPLSAWTAIIRAIWTWGTAIAVLTMPAKAVQVLRTKDRVNTSTTVLDQAPDTDRELERTIIKRCPYRVNAQIVCAWLKDLDIYDLGLTTSPVRVRTGDGARSWVACASSLCLCLYIDHEVSIRLRNSYRHTLWLCKGELINPVWSRGRTTTRHWDDVH